MLNKPILILPQPSPTMLKLSMAPGFRTCTSILSISIEIHSSGFKAPVFRKSRLVQQEPGERPALALHPFCLSVKQTVINNSPSSQQIIPTER